MTKIMTKRKRIKGRKKPVRIDAVYLAIPHETMKFLELASLATGKTRVQLVEESVRKYIAANIDIAELTNYELPESDI